MIMRPNPRTRLLTEVAPGDERPRRDEEKSVVILSGDGRNAPLLQGVDAINPVVVAMQKGVLLDVGNVLDRFAKLDRDVREFCNRCADTIGKTKQLPHTFMPSPPITTNGPVGRPPSDFSTVEDYISIVLLSIINLHLYRDIFRPFHPVATDEENRRYEKQYKEKIKNCEPSVNLRCSGLSK